MRARKHLRQALRGERTLANAAFTSAMVAASRSMARCADTVVQAAKHDNNGGNGAIENPHGRKLTA
jgi:hypothetical protein